MKIRRNFLFFAPDEGGASGAVMDAPPAADTGGDDLATMSAPDLDMTEAFLSDKTDVAPQAGTKPTPDKPAEPAPKPEAKKPEQQPQPEKKTGKPAPTGEPPAAHLRKELDAVRAERDDLKNRLGAGDPRVKEMEEAVKAKENELAEIRKEAETYRQKALLQDPTVAEELAKIEKPYNEQATRFYRSVPEIDQDSIYALGRQYLALPFNSPEYAVARREWEEKVNERLGGSEGVEHRKLASTLQFIEDTVEFTNRYQEAKQYVQQNAHKIAFDGQVKAWTDKHSTVTSLIKQAREVPEGMEQTNPLHPKVVLNKTLSVLKPEQRAKLEDGVEDFMKLALAGVKPRSEGDFAGMTPAQIKEAKANEQARYEKAFNHLADVGTNGMIALRLLPSLYKEIQRLQARVGEEVADAPPAPGSVAGGSETADDLATFKPTIPDGF